MSNPYETEPCSISESLPEVIMAMDQDTGFEPDLGRQQMVRGTDLRAEITELGEKRQALGEEIVAGAPSPELRERFDQVTRDLLAAQSDHIRLYGTTGSVPRNE